MSTLSINTMAKVTTCTSLDDTRKIYSLKYHFLDCFNNVFGKQTIKSKIIDYFLTINANTVEGKINSLYNLYTNNGTNEERKNKLNNNFRLVKETDTASKSDTYYITYKETRYNIPNENINPENFILLKKEESTGNITKYKFSPPVSDVEFGEKITPIKLKVDIINEATESLNTTIKINSRTIKDNNDQINLLQNIKTQNYKLSQCQDLLELKKYSLFKIETNVKNLHMNLTELEFMATYNTVDNITKMNVHNIISGYEGTLTIRGKEVRIKDIKSIDKETLTQLLLSETFKTYYCKNKLDKYTQDIIKHEQYIEEKNLQIEKHTKEIQALRAKLNDPNKSEEFYQRIIEKCKSDNILCEQLLTILQPITKANDLLQKLSNPENINAAQVNALAKIIKDVQDTLTPRNPATIVNIGSEENDRAILHQAIINHLNILDGLLQPFSELISA